MGAYFVAKVSFIGIQLPPHLYPPLGQGRKSDSILILTLGQGKLHGFPVKFSPTPGHILSQVGRDVGLGKHEFRFTAFGREEGKGGDGKMTGRPIGPVPSLDDFLVLDQFKGCASGPAVKNAERTADGPSDLSFTAGEGGVLFTVHQQFKNLMRRARHHCALFDVCGFHDGFVVSEKPACPADGSAGESLATPYGAAGRSRTDTRLPSRDFESRVSAISPRRLHMGRSVYAIPCLRRSVDFGYAQAGATPAKMGKPKQCTEKGRGVSTRYYNNY